MDPELKKLYITLLSNKNLAEAKYLLQPEPPRVDLFVDRDGRVTYRYHINIVCSQLIEKNGKMLIAGSSEIILGRDYEPDESKSKGDLLATLGV